MKKNHALLFILFILINVSCKTNKKNELIKFSGLAQGTTYSISYYDKEGRNFQKEIDSILKKFDLSVSIYDSTSIISKINKATEPQKVDFYFEEIFKLSQTISEQTSGAFDVTVGPLVNAFGFGFKNKENISKQLIDSLKKYVNYKNVKIENGFLVKNKPEISIDFNAIAQGYSVDVISEFLINKNIDNHIVEVGGEVIAKGKKEKNTYWKVGIEKPVDNNTDRELIVSFEIENKALATSGNYRKFYIENGIRYSHTINPATGYPVNHSLLSVSVLAERCAYADAYATAFMVMGLEKSKLFLENHKELEAYFIYSDSLGKNKTFETEGFKKIFSRE